MARRQDSTAPWILPWSCSSVSRIRGLLCLFKEDSNRLSPITAAVALTFFGPFNPSSVHFRWYPVGCQYLSSDPNPCCLSTSVLVNVLPDFLGIAKIATTHGNLYSGMTNGFEKCGANKAILLCGSVPGRVCLGPVVPYGFLLADVICLRLVTGVFLGFSNACSGRKINFPNRKRIRFWRQNGPSAYYNIHMCIYVISEVSSNCVMSFDCSMSSHGAESPSLAAANELGSRPLLRNSRGKERGRHLVNCWLGRNPKRGVNKVWTRHLGFWLNLWLRNTSGEIYFDLLEAASGTAVAVTLVAEPGGSCYQARKAWLLARVMRNPPACGVSYRASIRAPMTCGSSCRRPVSYMKFFQKKRRQT